MKTDIYQQVTDRMIEALEAGTVPWVRPWDSAGGLSHDSGLPFNFDSGKHYNGINVLLLWVSQMTAGYTDDAWLTFKQAKAKGGHVRKGEHGTPITFFKMYERKNDQGEKDFFPVIRQYTVFNVAQCEGLTLPAGENMRPPLVADHVPELDQRIAATGARIEHGGNRAFFRPGTDHIQMPTREQFHSAGDYYSTLLHELTHWTGGAARLARIKAYSSQFTKEKEAYAREELVAELGAAFQCARFGIDLESQSAAYLASWLQVMRDDKKAIFKAAKDAQTAVEHIDGYSAEADDQAEAA